MMSDCWDATLYYKTPNIVLVVVVEQGITHDDGRGHSGIGSADRHDTCYGAQGTTVL